MSDRVHLRTRSSDAACGMNQVNPVDSTGNPGDVTCGGCMHTRYYRMLAGEVTDMYPSPPSTGRPRGRPRKPVLGDSAT